MKKENVWNSSALQYVILDFIFRKPWRVEIQRDNVIYVNSENIFIITNSSYQNVEKKIGTGIYKP